MTIEYAAPPSSSPLLEFPSEPIRPSPRTRDAAASRTNEVLQNALRNAPAQQLRGIDWERHTVPKFIYQPGGQISPWPVFATSEARAAFGEIAAHVPGLLHRAIRAVFGRDPVAFERFLGWPSIIYEILLKAPVDVRDLVCRYDIVMERSGPKILELNCSSAAGGWQTDWLAPEVRRALAEWPGLDLGRAQHRPIFAAFARHLVASILRRKRAGAKGNLAFYSFVDPSSAQSLQECIQEVWNQERPPHWTQGRVLLFERMSDLTFGTDHEVTVKGVVVDAVMLTFPNAVEIDPSIMEALIRAYFAGSIAFPDSPFHTVLDSKMLFAVAHEARRRRLLDDRDAALVTRYLPWTVRTQNYAVSWRGEISTMREALLGAREVLVLKKADSFGGRDVVVGRFQSVRVWEDAVARSLAEEGWIAQTYSAPGQIDLCNGRSELAPHDLIWGVFGFEQSYGGAFIRGAYCDAGLGVVNSANGATEFLVFDECD